MGSLSSETGIIECLIRLPCSHLIGSHCIATWLHDNNTCPVCRRVFFPAQPRPHPGHGVIVNRDGDDAGELSRDDAVVLLYHEVERIEMISGMLGVSPAVCQLSMLIGRLSFHFDALRGSSRVARAAMSVFAASHLLGHPVTLDQLARVVERTRRSIYDTYRLFYPERHIVSNDSEFILLLREGSERAGIGSPTLPAWPRPIYADAIWDMMNSHFETEHETILIEVSCGILSILMVKPYFNHNEILRVVALSIYLASHLRQISVSCAEISAVTGVSVGDLRATYAAFYPHREDLLEYRLFASTSIDLERLVADLPHEIP